MAALCCGSECVWSGSVVVTTDQLTGLLLAFNASTAAHQASQTGVIFNGS